MLPRSAIVGDFGAQGGQFFAALKSNHSISRALLVEARVDDVCKRMRTEGYLIVKAKWPNVDDVLFVNLKVCRP